MNFLYILVSIQLFLCQHKASGIRTDFGKHLINTTSGLVKGGTIDIFNRTIAEYIGIPYAEPPVGALRFAKPKPLSKPIEGIIDATKVKKSCFQPPVPTIVESIDDMSEDCLHLNIWSPIEQKQLLSVIFWIYPGAFMIGSTTWDIVNASALATRDVVVVVGNYRVNWFGMLFAGQTAPGNQALYDQTLCLIWVRDNIHLFGGDKNKITLLGHSAGSMSVSAHLISPISRGLFKRAILKGGAHFYNKDRPIISKEEALIEAKQMADDIGCSGHQWLQCLREVDVHKIPLKSEPMFPIDGTEFLPLTAQNSFEQGQFNKDVDVLAGVTKDEGSLLSFLFDASVLAFNPLGLHYKHFISFVAQLDKMFHNLDIDKLARHYLNNTDINNTTAIRGKIYDIVGDLTTRCPTYLFAKKYAQFSAPGSNVYFYELTYSPTRTVLGIDLGVFHASELELLFRRPLIKGNRNCTQEDIEFSKEYMKLFTDFAKYGKPDPEWHKMMGTEALPALEFIRDLNPRHKKKYSNNLFKESCNGIWKDYF